MTSPEPATQPLLAIRDLRTYFHTSDGVARSVDGVSFEVFPSETVAVVGESGCGKSVTAFTIMGLIPVPPGRVESGEIVFEDRDLLKLSEAEMRDVRGNDISMIFQEPMTSLNPILTIGRQITEAILRHTSASKADARRLAIEMLSRVGIPSPEKRVDEYPHQLSGGMKQRAMIAMALVCRPKLLIADEPTTALDVTIQSQILDLLHDLREEFDMAVLLITHDLGVVAEVADRVVVMYAGKIVETADVVDLFERPQHPYTRALFQSLPSLEHRGETLNVIPGNVPNPLEFPTGCRFRTRCTIVRAECASFEPELVEVAPGHKVACPFSTAGSEAS
ncbi:MAG: ABC transporter ATP-binding protein [Blastocatellia bacterium]|jgi:oligopeptide/dipeptide ABC transporter ATP-binding protein|nr:ABC transporter ATP-binding protein [Blastocatellia bacterium]